MLSGWTETGTGHGMGLSDMRSAEAQKIWGELKPVAPAPAETARAPVPVPRAPVPVPRAPVPVVAETNSSSSGAEPARPPPVVAAAAKTVAPRTATVTAPTPALRQGSSRSDDGDELADTWPSPKQLPPSRPSLDEPAPLASALLSGPVQSLFPSKSFFTKSKWKSGRWTFDGATCELRQYASSVPNAELIGCFRLTTESRARDAKSEKGALEISVLDKKKRLLAPQFDAKNAERCGQVLLKPAGAELAAWRAAVAAAIEAKKHPERLFVAPVAAPVVPAATAPSPAPYVRRVHASEALRADAVAPKATPTASARLVELRADLAELVQGVELVEEEIKDPSKRLVSKSSLARLNGELDKLQFAKIDSIVTTDIHDEADKIQAKTLRKKLNVDVELLRQRISAAHQKLMGR